MHGSCVVEANLEPARSDGFIDCPMARTAVLQRFHPLSKGCQSPYLRWSKTEPPRSPSLPRFVGAAANAVRRRVRTSFHKTGDRCSCMIRASVHFKRLKIRLRRGSLLQQCGLCRTSFMDARCLGGSNSSERALGESGRPLHLHGKSDELWWCRPGALQSLVLYLALHYFRATPLEAIPVVLSRSGSLTAKDVADLL